MRPDQMSTGRFEDPEVEEFKVFKMEESKVRARIVTLRIRLQHAKECEDFGKAAFIAGQIFERELILEDLLS